ncbi:MAG: hypothetical protein FWH23_05145 [Bacteroidales bacterium]|nr:hypothetical protein [Bacteroidales bacterium]
MKKILLIAAIVGAALASLSCQNSPSTQAEYYHWIGEEQEAIIFTRMDKVFRGAFIDSDFQEYASLPIAGIIDNDGNVNGICFDSNNGNLYSKITGKIIGDTFEAEWIPTPNARSEYRNISMKLQKLSPEIESENRVTPFLSEKIIDAEGQLYGYQIGEWEMKLIHVAQGIKKEEVDFHLHIEESGINEIVIDIQGAAKLTDNTFRYKEKSYEFEIAIYNDFITLTTISGNWDGYRADGVYPLQPKGND